MPHILTRRPRATGDGPHPGTRPPTPGHTPAHSRMTECSGAGLRPATDVEPTLSAISRAGASAPPSTLRRGPAYPVLHNPDVLPEPVNDEGAPWDGRATAWPHPPVRVPRIRLPSARGSMPRRRPLPRGLPATGRPAPRRLPPSRYGTSPVRRRGRDAARSGGPGRRRRHDRPLPPRTAPGRVELRGSPQRRRHRRPTTSPRTCSSGRRRAFPVSRTARPPASGCCPSRGARWWTGSATMRPGPARRPGGLARRRRAEPAAQPYGLRGGRRFYRGSAVRPACSPCRSDPPTVRPPPFSAARSAPCAPASRVPASLWQP